MAEFFPQKAVSVRRYSIASCCCPFIQAAMANTVNRQTGLNIVAEIVPAVIKPTREGGTAESCATQKMPDCSAISKDIDLVVTIGPLEHAFKGRRASMKQGD